MSVDEKEIIAMFWKLNAANRTSVYDFMQYLIERDNKSVPYEEIDQLESDNEPISDEVLHRINNAKPEDYLTGEEAMREFPGIQVDLP